MKRKVGKKISNKPNPKQPILDEQDAELLETGKFYDAQGSRYLPPEENGASKAELESMTMAWLAQAKKKSQATKNPKKSGKRRKN